MITINDISYNLRLIIDRVPRSTILIVLLSIIILIPFPETITGKITLANLDNQDVCAIGQLPYYYITAIEEGKCVQIELEGFKTKKDGNQIGYITNINTKEEKTSHGKYFSYSIFLKNNPFLIKGMEGKVSISLPNRSLLLRLVNLFDDK